ncbi:hypothetical protein GP475_03385 [Corynebacterium poyangense]|uniref:Uncharacterized protein n=1 Tax=Corynebacterium poyangense TaxID=2684405 RepID=A0A7H0SMM5_9CORY|nr:hypothetical protein [Corynebacterium poyangense]MBZ8176906.1 hypothetical protein [Corynebacterium poyangense]QNQ89800.1 hypothetical protein GP475_03385 [Corynebacterium poyangense]
MSHIQLRPTSHIFLRDAGSLQCGVDARHCGVIEHPRARVLVRLLLTARAPRLESDLIQDFIDHGFDPVFSNTIIAELKEFQVLAQVSGQTHRVALLGKSRVSKLLTSLFLEIGYRVHRPLSQETPQQFLAHLPAQVPIILENTIGQARKFHRHWATRGRTWIPVSTWDGQGFIGPLHIRGSGPCPLCADLYFHHWDPHLPHLGAQAARMGFLDDPLSAASTAARVLGLTRQLLEPPAFLSPRPATPHLQPEPGLFLHIDPFSPQLNHRMLPVHHGCPSCFQRLS